MGLASITNPFIINQLVQPATTTRTANTRTPKLRLRHFVFVSLCVILDDRIQEHLQSEGLDPSQITQ